MASFQRALSDPVNYPKSMGDYITGIHLCTAVNCTLFHQSRTTNGQKVSVNLARSGHFAWHVGISIVSKTPSMHKIYSQSAEFLR